LQPTILATGAKLQQDVRRLGQGWRVAIFSVLVLATPAAAVAALLAQDIVQVLYGPAWAESALILSLLFLCLPAWAAWGVSTPILWNTGRKQLESLLQVPVLAFALGAWWLAAPSGLRAMALVSVAVIFARAAVIVAAALRALGLSWTVLAGPLGRGLSLAALSCAAALGARLLVSGMGVPLLDLLAGGGGAFGALLLVALARPQLFGSEARDVLARLLPSLRAEPGAALPAQAEVLPR
jgi:O-antigen/teichoic acid export membrane protein